jgi:hypothetical protein
MIHRVLEASYVRDYIIHLRFSDGSEGDVNLEKELEGEIFEPLKDVAYFQRFTVHPELHTLTWPNGADFAPEFLRDLLKIPA